ncbi:LOW QUALITY PROTEIN: hypothetical protein T265_13800 [Opisthorchis viverrini]|uniref:Uncharacterized protein n=1 Tax=Opisthorchis viverrini TaxID=6198 RepID=A0A074ZK54_OPIVI|nr:LOW QUALITY PROTEIN: hypothetical protein T265_13800 [Opisthorchis viverrini]KER27431.1 LOW QUALITY PROTEIN: hypothetical protein T265_13800 [Opisthorchis viverrini]
MQPSGGIAAKAPEGATTERVRQSRIPKGSIEFVILRYCLDEGEQTLQQTAIVHVRSVNKCTGLSLTRTVRCQCPHTKQRRAECWLSSSVGCGCPFRRQSRDSHWLCGNTDLMRKRVKAGSANGIMTTDLSKTEQDLVLNENLGDQMKKGETKHWWSARPGRKLVIRQPFCTACLAPHRKHFIVFRDKPLIRIDRPIDESATGKPADEQTELDTLPTLSHVYLAEVIGQEFIDPIEFACPIPAWMPDFKALFLTCFSPYIHSQGGTMRCSLPVCSICWMVSCRDWKQLLSDQLVEGGARCSLALGVSNRSVQRERFGAPGTRNVRDLTKQTEEAGSVADRGPADQSGLTEAWERFGTSICYKCGMSGHGRTNVSITVTNSGFILLFFPVWVAISTVIQAKIQAVIEIDWKRSSCLIDTAAGPLLRQILREHLERLSVVYLLWLTIVSLAVAYNFVTIPLREAFDVYDGADYQFYWYIGNIFADCAYLLDILCARPRVEFNQDGLVKNDFKSCALNYLKAPQFKTSYVSQISRRVTSLSNSRIGLNWPVEIGANTICVIAEELHKLKGLSLDCEWRVHLCDVDHSPRLETSSFSTSILCPV